MKFSEALDRNMEEIKRPPNLPTGNYTWQVKKHPEIDEFESRNTGDTFERITFQLACVSPSDDVDTDELDAYGNVEGALNRKSFLFNTNPDEKAAFDRSLFNIKRFLGHLGLDVDEDGITLSDALAASVNAQCLGEITHRPDPNDPEIVYAEVGRTAEV